MWDLPFVSMLSLSVILCAFSYVFSESCQSAFKSFQTVLVKPLVHSSSVWSAFYHDLLLKLGCSVTYSTPSTYITAIHLLSSVSTPTLETLCNLRNFSILWGKKPSRLSNHNYKGEKILSWIQEAEFNWDLVSHLHLKLKVQLKM
jgi:hypothetical protein